MDNPKYIREPLKNMVSSRNLHTSSEKRELATKTYQKKIRRGTMSALQPTYANCSSKHVFQGFLRVKVIPKSPETKLIEEMNDGTLKIRVKAPPEKNKANKELIRFLAKYFGTRKESITIISGKTDPLKLIKIV